MDKKNIFSMLKSHSEPSMNIEMRIHIIIKEIC